MLALLQHVRCASEARAVPEWPWVAPQLARLVRVGRQQQLPWQAAGRRLHL
jgi:hypothetical protein